MITFSLITLAMILAETSGSLNHNEMHAPRLYRKD
jgi:hypothetical protein